MKPLIIGQAPARGNEGKLPFAGASGRRLAQLAGVGDDGDVLRHHFELVNLLREYPGKRGKGDDFDRFKAKDAASDLVRVLHYTSPRYILLMGHNVARAFGFRNWNYLENHKIVRHVWMVFPHPSGINRWWNEPHNEQRAGRMIREVLRRAG